MIDLHTHTDQSDGTVSPEQLVHRALDLRLEALGIADHDTFAGYDLAAPIAAYEGLELICGIELSTRPPRDKSGRRVSSVHLLGYFLNQPPTVDFRDWLLAAQESRRKRNVALIARLETFGIEITLEEVQALGRHLTGRPHFAQVLLERGYVSSIQEAFDIYLADHAKAAVEREEPKLLEGVQRVAAAGGMPSLAHPVRLLQGREPRALRNLIGELVDAGLQGIEVYHSEHDTADIELYSAIASEFRLAITGGSDFHGENKPVIALGTGRDGNLALPYSVLQKMRKE